MKHFKANIAVAALLGALLSPYSSNAQGIPAGSKTLLELSQPGATFQVGDKLFSDFHNISQSGDLFVPLDQIFVFGIVGGPATPEDELGIRFQSSLWTLNGANKLYDLSLDFHVAITNPDTFFSDNTLEITGGATGSGLAFLSEGVLNATPGQPAQTLANKLVQIAAGSSSLQDHKVFPQPWNYTALEISKDFSMSTGSVPGSVVFVSHFDQTFSQVPEPGTALFGLALVGVIGSRRRR